MLLHGAHLAIRHTIRHAHLTSVHLQICDEVAEYEKYIAELKKVRDAMAPLLLETGALKSTSAGMNNIHLVPQCPQIVDVTFVYVSEAKLTHNNGPCGRFGMILTDSQPLCQMGK